MKASTALHFPLGFKNNRYLAARFPRLPNASTLAMPTVLTPAKAYLQTNHPEFRTLSFDV